MEDTRWFTDEVQPHAPQLKAYLRGSFPTVRDVDDVVQESFLRLWRARAAGPILSAGALLFTVARRIALNVVRKHRNAPFAEASEVAITAAPSDTPDSLDALIARERIELLADALIALPPSSASPNARSKRRSATASPAVTRICRSTESSSLRHHENESPVARRRIEMDRAAARMAARIGPRRRVTRRRRGPQKAPTTARGHRRRRHRDRPSLRCGSLFRLRARRPWWRLQRHLPARR